MDTCDQFHKNCFQENLRLLQHNQSQYERQYSDSSVNHDEKVVYETVWIRNGQKMDRFCGKLVSFLLTLTNTLTYYGISALRFRIGFIVLAPHSGNFILKLVQKYKIIKYNVY